MTGAAHSDGPVLVLNAGSSSLKYQLVVPETGEVRPRASIERIGEPGGPGRPLLSDHDHERALDRAGVNLWGCAQSGTGWCTAAPTSPTR